MSRSLSGAQFGGLSAYEVTTLHPDPSGDALYDQSNTRYSIHEPDKDESGYHRGITAKLRHPRTRFNTQPQEWATTIRHDDRVSSVRAGWDGNQGTLFGYEHRKPAITYLLSNEEHRHFVPHLLGHVAQESMSRFGERPVADRDLSRHSSRMVARLAESGLVEQPGVHEEVRNDMTFPGRGAVVPRPPGATSITPDRLESGKRRVVEGLRATRQKSAPRTPRASGSEKGPGKGQLSLFDHKGP